jgi:hypothetical protein
MRILVVKKCYVEAPMPLTMVVRSEPIVAIEIPPKKGIIAFIKGFTHGYSHFRKPVAGS